MYIYSDLWNLIHSQLLKLQVHHFLFLFYVTPYCESSIIKPFVGYLQLNLSTHQSFLKCWTDSGKSTNRIPCSQLKSRNRVNTLFSEQESSISTVSCTIFVTCTLKSVIMLLRFVNLILWNTNYYRSDSKQTILCRYQSCRPCGILLWNSSGNVFVEMFRWDSQQEE
jgi:hypothetical protein